MLTKEALLERLDLTAPGMDKVAQLLEKGQKDEAIDALINHFRNRTDMVNTVAEGLDMVCEVAHPAIRLLADSYHMLLENESLDIFKKAAPYLVHCHFACGKERTFPTLQESRGFKEFITALQDSGYDKRLSIEGATENFIKDATESIAVFRTLEKERWSVL